MSNCIPPLNYMKGTLFLGALFAAAAVMVTLPTPTTGDEPLLVPFLDALYDAVEDVSDWCQDQDLAFLCDSTFARRE